MISVYALALINGLITENDILKIEDKTYLNKVLKRKNEIIEKI